MSAKTWFAETRPQFLVLSVVLVLLGTAAAAAAGPISWLRFGLTLLGLLLLHVGCNVLNDWFDFRSGIDLHTERTPFSGGSGFLPAGALPPGGVFALGAAGIVLGSAVGLLLVFMTSWELLIIGAAGVGMATLYNPLLSKLMLGELAAGLGMGFLPVIGTYFVQRGSLPFEAVYVAVPAGFLVHNLLLLNEIPDAKADALGGRRHMVIVFGPRTAGRIYAAINLAVYLWIGAGAAFGILSPWTLLAFLTLPLAAKGAQGALRHYADPPKLIPAQGANVGMVLVTQVLLAAGIFLAIVT
jgi:1,4-dihydroxy-2-naphthoate octaprenyltransferase